MDKDMETGVVLIFFPKERRKYGFIRTAKGDIVFFHFNDGEFLRPGRKYPKFCGDHYRIIQGKQVLLPEPKPGDEVVFYRAKKPRGDAASPWTYQTKYDRIAKIIAKRTASIRIPYSEENPDWNWEQTEEHSEVPSLELVF